MTIDLTPSQSFPDTEEGRQQKQQYDAEEKKKAEDKYKQQISDRKTRLKKDGKDLNSLSRQLAAMIPGQGGMSVSDFKNWAEQFESGYTTYTPSPTDTPYEQPYSQRPKVRILSEGTDYK
jgi:NAD+--asparagine ADP-ribosyltransferase